MQGQLLLVPVETHRTNIMCLLWAAGVQLAAHELQHLLQAATAPYNLREHSCRFGDGLQNAYCVAEVVCALSGESPTPTVSMLLASCVIWLAWYRVVSGHAVQHNKHARS